MHFYRPVSVAEQDTLAKRFLAWVVLCLSIELLRAFNNVVFPTHTQAPAVSAQQPEAQAQLQPETSAALPAQNPVPDLMHAASRRHQMMSSASSTAATATSGEPANTTPTTLAQYAYVCLTHCKSSSSHHHDISKLTACLVCVAAQKLKEQDPLPLRTSF